jgi:hypothetical protein
MGKRLILLLSLWAAAYPAAQSDPLPIPTQSADQVLAEACRAEFRYLLRVCREFDVDGPSTQMTGLQSDVPQTQWPLMQFCYFGFACANLATYDSTMRRSALEEMPWLIENLQKPRLTGFISEHFGPPFGPGFVQPSVFVHGMFLNLAVRYREVSGDTRFDPLMRQVASSLSEAFGNSTEGILPTYRDMWWLGDNLPALSALVRYDRLFGTALSAVKRRYVQSVKEAYLDERGMFSSYIDPEDRQVLQGSRGVSAAYALHFLHDVDPAFAREQYELAKRHLYRTALGFAAVREFPTGSVPSPDIDSGAVLFGFGTAASGFFVAAAAVNGDDAAGWALLSSLGLCSGAEFRRDGTELALNVMPPVGQAVILFGKTELLKRRHITGKLLLESSAAQ